MKKQLYSAPETFSLLPLLALLPVRGSVSRLHALTSSLFARFEKVQSMQRDASGSGEIERDLLRRLAAEEAMLRQVLDWLEVKPDGGGSDV